MENHGKTIGKPWENHGKTVGKWENHRKTIGKWWFHGIMNGDLPSGNVKIAIENCH